jgi:hypothetical protein
MTATNSTISGNSATQPGAGIFATTAVTLQWTTVAGNNTGASAAGSQIGGTPTLRSFASVIGTGAGTSSCQVSTTTSDGYNYEQTSNTCGFGAGTGDVPSGADPMLLSLGQYGGPIPTRLFSSQSPLKNAVPASNPACTGLDERGITRPQGAGCDIGAVEMRLPVATDGTATTELTTPVTVDLHNFVVDPDAWFDTAVYTVTQPTHGTADPTGNGLVVYTAESGFAGTDPFGYQVCGANNVCVNGTITVTVTGTPPARPVPATPRLTG